VSRGRSRDGGPDGVAVVDKPPGWTSHDVVAKARGTLGTRRVGHSGTLDPDATGVLVLGVGRVTRCLRFLTALPKSYVGEIVLGVETSTLDAAGEVLATHDMSSVEPDDVVAAARQFTGAILQVPPMVSAVKVGGRRLHELARAGEEVEREARPVTVHRFDVVPVAGEPGVYRAEVDCSSGTYVRTLAADLGHALGGGAHLRRLRRTAVGSFDLGTAVPLDRLDVDALLPPREALRDHPSVTIAGDVRDDVRHGRVLPLDAVGPPAAADGVWAVLDEDGTLLAVYEPHRRGTAKPAVVLAPAST
jgi:tRNA pseudouridine55 synthase